MRTGIATVSMGGLLPAKLAAIAAAGFEGVELFETDVVAHDEPPETIRARCADLGLEVIALQPLRDFEGLPEPFRARAFDRARRKLDLANRLGAPRILVCSSIHPAALGGVDRAAGDVRDLAALAAGAGVEIGFEALAWGRHVSDWRDAWEIVRRADHPNAKLILDSFHILSRKFPVEPIRAVPADRISFVQVSDAPRIEMDVLQLSRHHRCFPGQGELDIAGFMAVLDATGYDGWISHEVFSDRFRMGRPKLVAEDGERSMIHVLGRGRSGAPLPPVSPATGVAFLEFAVGGAEAEALKGLFRALGFAHAGAHRAKKVDRFLQGGVNLVVNAEETGLAHSHRLVHGPSVCAIGLRVGDAAVAMARAEALLATPFSQRRSEAEFEMPAIRGVGGALLYFLDGSDALGAVWETEFEPVEEPAAAVGVSGVDHVNQSVPFEELQSWRLFYSAVLGFDRTPQVDVADPVGLVESQVLYSEDRSVRFALNASAARGAQSNRFIQDYFGAGVQHVAFAVPDALEAAAAMRAAGAPILEIPANYYDDIAARFGLAPDHVAALREGNVLYDEDAGGRFLQVYTQPFAERFFFEIVERKGYEGYGAPNAPIRLAAQARLGRDAAVPPR